ncbi:MAG: CoA transferase [Dehalococcoidia bacterium]|nr:CoA transferase [Dehalococcoidia bacterium]
MTKMPLEGIRVIEWAMWQMGPSAASMLGDLGAQVIKIEDRIGGDPARGVGSICKAVVKTETRNIFFDAFNRSKQSITLDIQTEQGREIFYQLIEKSDVFLHNMRVGVAERQGIDYATLAKRNPKLIYAHASAFGPKGPDAGRPAVDYVGQSRSAFMTTVGEPQMPPVYAMGTPADQMGALMTVSGIVTALLARERFGIGQKVDISLLGSMVALQTFNVSATLNMGQPLPRMPRAGMGNPIYNHYRCGDDKWLVLAMQQSDRHWPEFCQAVGLENLIDDPRSNTIPARTANAETIIAILDKLFATKPRHEWLKILDGKDFVYGPINDMKDLVRDRQVLENDYIIEYDDPGRGKIKMIGFPVKLSKTPARVQSPIPEFGQHTEEVLEGVLGYSWEKIAQLREQHVI